LPKIHHIAITTRAPEKLAAFYLDILGLPEIKRHFHEDGTLRSVWLELEYGAILMIEKQDLPPEEGNGFHLLAFSVTESEKSSWKEKLAKAGVEIYNSTNHTLYFMDPDGNRIGLSSYKL